MGQIYLRRMGPYGLLIYDVTNPAAPILLSQFTANDPVWDVAIAGTTALVAADASGLVALDISNPVQVRQLSQTILPIVNPFPPPMEWVRHQSSCIDFNPEWFSVRRDVVWFRIWIRH